VASTAAPNLIRVLPAVWRFVRYLRKVIAAKRTQPQDDLISALVRAEEAGDRLREDELVAMAFLLVVAGHETTVNLIGNGVLALMQFPEQRERLAADWGLEATAVEELLRFHSPIEVATERYSREPIEIAGVTIPTGALVYGLIASANRDEASAGAFTTAWGPRSRGWRARSLCADCSNACRACGWRCPSPRCAGGRD